MSKSKNQYTSGDKLGRWTLNNLVGEGGNGEVWIALSNNETCAIKILKTNDKDKLARFKEEIRLITQEAKGIPGIIEIIDYDSSENPKWFTMPVAENSLEYFKRKTFSEKISLFLKLTETILKLHEKDITHRDIKPANILVLNGKLTLTDFGLGHRPTREDNWTIDSKRRGVGATSTIAPEMRWYPKENPNADYKLADVYSLAKTLWIYLTGNELGFEGEYVKLSSLSLRNYIEDESVPMIEEVLLASTKTDPLDRPNIEDFYAEIFHIHWNVNDFKHTNQAYWLDVIKTLFPISIPQYSRWSNTIDIFNIFSIIIQAQHYAFYPTRGGNTFESLEIDHHEIKLTTRLKSSITITNSILTFHAFKKMPTFNYFRLECDYEEDGYGSYKHGVFLFFSKASLYNQTQKDDGVNNKLSDLEFRQLIESMISYCEQNNIAP